MRLGLCLLVLFVVCVVGSFRDTECPEFYQVEFDTSKGRFVVDVTRSWAPNGADRFYNLVTERFYDNTPFFRVVPGFVVQWGINGDPYVNDVWKERPLEDDPVVEGNGRGTISFASHGPNTRTTQVFINYRDNFSLDRQGFQVFGFVSSGLAEVVDKIEDKYAKQNVNQFKAMTHGSDYFEENFPDMDYIYTATIRS